MRQKKRTGGLCAGLALLLSITASGCASSTEGDRVTETFANPLLASGPDPWVFAHRGAYYYTHTLGDRIELWHTEDMAALAQADKRVVWTAPKAGANAHSIWAPELHRIDDKWYIYYSATAAGFKDDRHRAVFVLENSADDPLAGKWIDRGRINTREAGIDGTVFEHDGALYFAYSPYIGAVSGIALARMENPWTLTGEETVIARPDMPWENRGGRKILEGPQFLEGPNGDIFMTYSAGACWSDDYALGLLRAKPGAPLLDAANWTKSERPVLAKGNGIYATGHNGFFRSPDGREDWIIYHANSGPGMDCTAKRAPHMQRIIWNTAGEPNFGERTPPSVRLAKPSGTRSNE